MGKYMRKRKTTREVGVMDASLGVRTRARTLALQSSADYLQLRSRRLEKPSSHLLLNHQFGKTPPPKHPHHHRGAFLCTDSQQSSNSAFPIETPFQIEPSPGENDSDSDARESRCTRESTPCSMFRATDTITSPGSSTRQRSPIVANQRAQNVLRNIPTAREMDDFFAYAEQLQQHHFIEKYNFDIVNDLPLPGRYEWVRVMP